MIRELTGKYRFLSNFWSCFIEFGGDVYPSVENAYQAAKCSRPEDRVLFQTLKASEAKKRGRVIKIRKGWDGMKLDVMLQLVRAKFEDPTLRSLLLDTGDDEIQEGNWWGDTYWGTTNCRGQNHLGKILMRVRGEIRKEVVNGKS